MPPATLKEKASLDEKLKLKTPNPPRK